MSSLSLLDVVIAMVFFFLLLSLVCSAANEIFAALLQTRARFLERGIKRLLVTDDFANSLYSHPLIKSLSDEVDPIFKTIHKALPSYIPSRSFALAMMDLMRQDAGPGNAQAAIAGGASVAIGTTAVQTTVPAQVMAALNSLFEDVSHDPAKTRQCIEDWYDAAMERVSGVYKRRTQYVLFTLGLIAAILVNADSVAVIERLAISKTLASAVVDAATQFEKESASPKVQTATVSPEQAAANAQTSLETTLNTLDKLQLPIGWKGPADANQISLDVTHPGNTAFALARQLSIHWIGWLITALAVSFGAPFWFDLLNRFMVVRSTIKPQTNT